MSIKSTKRNARSIYQTKYVTIGKVLQNFKYLENEKSFWGEIKKLFPTFLKSFQLPKILSDQRAHLSLVFCCETCENLKITMENNCERLLLFLQILLNSEESKHLCQTLYVISARLKACTFIKKKKKNSPQHRCFLVKFAKVLRTQQRWLLLKLFIEQQDSEIKDLSTSWKLKIPS